LTDYVVGDIQGCYSGLRRLLDKAKFNPKKDTLYAVGDLVARGTESLETLEYLFGLGDSFASVLGNHDLHFLAIVSGLKEPKKSDYLTPLLSHKKCHKYVAWLRKKPLALRLGKDVLITHAGLYPQWSFKKALKLSDEIQLQLTDKKWQNLLREMYGNEPTLWNKGLQGIARTRFIINAFTRMRFLTLDAQLEFSSKAAPKSSPPNIVPWFSLKNENLNKKQRVIFGHWAALMGETGTSKFVGLDTGFVWGNQLTLFNLDTNERLSVCNIKK